MHVDNLDAKELDVFARLTENQLRHYYEPHGGLFIAESRKVIERALDAGCEPVSLLVEERFADCGLVTGALADVPVWEASYEVLKELVGYPLTGGMLCAMRRPRTKTAAEVLAGARRVAVLVDVTNPTNVGAIFRTAAALSMDAVLLTGACADPLYRRAIRVSMGNVFRLPWGRFELPCGLEELKREGFLTAALALTGDSVSIEHPAIRDAGKLALLLGNEGDGLPADVLEACQYTVKIPMAEGVDSLNVGAAAAVAFWCTGRRGAEPAIPRQ